MIKLSLSMPVTDNTPLKEAVMNKLGAKSIKNVVILKKSVDARKKDAIKYLYSVAVEADNENRYINKDCSYYDMPICSIDNMVKDKKYDGKVVVVGSGPAGLFAALTLAKIGAKPIVLERGENVDERTKTIKKFFTDLTLKSDSNVQFGEGGAGTFSDGKLNTNLHNEYIPIVLNEFIKAGAPEEIAYLAKPHIGTDNLINVVKNLRKQIEEAGGEFLFNTKLTDLIIKDGKVVGAVTDGGVIDCDRVYLATGHSARDTFEMLYAKGVNMVSKTFSMGVRIEHLRNDINYSQYGENAKYMPTADYKLATETSTGKSLYTFCMCPGGRVINSSSEDGGVCVNGMSYYARNDVNSNSAVLVNVDINDWKSEHPLAGMQFQRKYENLTYKASGGFKPIVQLFGDLENKKITYNWGKIKPSVETGYTFGDMRACLPDGIVDTIVDGVHLFGRKLRGFDRYDSVLTGIEARSSSPVRILRDEKYCSNVIGLYPIGEGAGYAGGITSSAIDGIKSVIFSI